MIYVHSDLIHKHRTDLSDDFDCIWIELKLKHRKYLYGTFYRSPSQLVAQRDQYLSKLKTILDRARNLGYDGILFNGDFMHSQKHVFYKEMRITLVDYLMTYFLKKALTNLYKNLQESRETLLLVLTSP